MEKAIYITPVFSRQISRLRKADKKALLAVKQYEKILEKIVHLSQNPALDCKRKLTKYGEMRLDDCRKYDLGSGYRLITVQQNNCVILAFIGSHDSCHKWLEKRKKEGQGTARLIKLDTSELKASIDAVVAESEFVEKLAKGQDLYEEKLLQRLDQKTLRHIFAGLCRSSSQCDGIISS